MRNAKHYDERITIGGVPNAEDLRQLEQCGYRTLVDLRDETERFGGEVGRRAAQIGLRYVSIPISRESIELQDVARFYRTVFEPGAEPFYVFSRFGKKPLAFLLLLEAVARLEPVQKVYRRASQFGLPLSGDICLQEFLVGILNGDGRQAILESVREHRPELLDPVPRVAAGSLPSEGERIAEALAVLHARWCETGDRDALREALLGVVGRLDAVTQGR